MSHPSDDPCLRSLGEEPNEAHRGILRDLKRALEAAGGLVRVGNPLTLNCKPYFCFLIAFMRGVTEQ